VFSIIGVIGGYYILLKINPESAKQLKDMVFGPLGLS
jgi:hypothetical protein